MTDLFRAFIPTKGKESLVKFKNVSNSDLYTYEQVKNLPSYAGILGEDTILVDIDNEKDGALIWKIIQSKGVKCRVHRTDNGWHFFFVGGAHVKCKTKKTLACGIKAADIKLGKRNSYAVLKLNNVERKVVSNPDEIDKCPAWLLPVETDVDFSKMKEGDGRNSTLYSYILTLISAGLSKEQARETLGVINEFILSEPLEESELNTIMRDEAFPSEVFFEKNKFLFYKFAQFLEKEEHFIKIDKVLHFYADGKYIRDEDRIRGTMLKYLPRLSHAQRNETHYYLKDYIWQITPRTPAEYVAFKNGVFNVMTKEFLPHSPEYIITNVIPWDYNPNAYSEIVDVTLNKMCCQDASMRALLEEIIGSCFYRSNTLGGGKAFILLGDKSNGKSTFLDLLITLLGEDNVSNLSLQELDQRFKTADIFDKLSVIGDDIPATWIPDASIFKKIVTGNRTNAEFKNKDTFNMRPYCKLLFSANDMPRIKDETGAVTRRIIPVPFRAVFKPTDADYDPHIKYKLMTQQGIEYLIRLGLEGLERVLDRNEYTVNDNVLSELKTIDELNNPTIGFIDEVGEDFIINNTTKAVYGRYMTYCIENGLNTASANSLNRQINKRLGTETRRKQIDGEQFKIFVKK